MSGVATAIGAAAVVGTAGTIYSANKASSATTNASNNAIAAQNNALKQQEAIAAPYVAEGTANLPTYNALLNGSTAQQTLENTPGYKATLATGTEAAQRAAAASGLNLSGNQVAGTEAYGAQLADSTYQQALQNLLAPIQIGQAAAAGTSANIGNTANNISNQTIAQGTNNANITANEVAGINKATAGAANQYTTLNTLNNLSNPTSTPTYGPPSGNFDGSGGGVPTYTGPATVPGFS